MNSGLLTSRCDPYGAESSIRLLGGTIDERHKGKYNWYCPERAEARFRFICRGGEYGERRQPDGGLITAFSCPGGHTGPVMPLCRKHQHELGQGPPAPGFDSSMRPYGVVGGTKANEMCPACAMPPLARGLQDQADQLQQQIAQIQMLGLIGEAARLETRQAVIREQLTELYHTGQVHRCPLILREVS
jgi:hypothetical protein